MRPPKLTPHLEHGTPKAGNNAAERAMLPSALGRKNHLLIGSQAGGRAAAAAHTLISTTKLRRADPEAPLADTPARIPNHKITHPNETVPQKHPQPSPATPRAYDDERAGAVTCGASETEGRSAGSGTWPRRRPPAGGDRPRPSTTPRHAGVARRR